MAIQVQRRAFIGALGGAAGWPLAARTQQSAMPVIGFLGSESPDLFTDRLRGFRQGLSESGYIEGKNVVVEYRWADGQNDRWPALATELVSRQVTVITAPGSTAASLAAKAATTTIPIVFFIGGDPVAAGLVASLARPGGNVTGVTTLSVEVGAKRVELMREAIPSVTIMALLVNPTNPNNAEAVSRETRAAAHMLGLQLHVLHASTEREFDSVFASLAQLRAGALVISPDPFFFSRCEQLGALTLRHKMPTISPYREFAAAGGLISYGTNIADLFRQVGAYTSRILKGEKPADLPVQQVTKVDMLINLKTARAFGLTFPITLLGRADEVIE
jgi:putative tryptophan/tyrosine transport system substrate-binding protein